MINTLEELKALLDTLNIPVAYSHFNKATSTPYLVYYVDGQDNTFADNIVYLKTMDITIELYTDKKDVTLEGQLEKLLNDNELPYNMTSELYISEDKLYEIVYNIKI